MFRNNGNGTFTDATEETGLKGTMPEHRSGRNGL